jgi:hypothetical protein
MNSARLLQAARGPILLIVLGVLLAIDHFGPASFWRTWPLLVITYGVMKLLERVVSRPEPYGAAPYEPGRS